MKKFVTHFSALAILLAISIGLQANEKTETANAPTLSDFEWLVGHWAGDGLGGICEETWLPASGGIMLGTFKLMQEGKVNFFEIMTLTIDSIGPAVRVKHFNADMTGWEDKADMVTFRYDSTSAGEIFFGGLRFSKPAEDSLRIGVRFKKSDGTRDEKFINCQRLKID